MIWTICLTSFVSTISRNRDIKPKVAELMQPPSWSPRGDLCDVTKLPLGGLSFGSVVSLSLLYVQNFGPTPWQQGWKALTSRFSARSRQWPNNHLYLSCVGMVMPATYPSVIAHIVSWITTQAGWSHPTGAPGTLSCLELLLWKKLTILSETDPLRVNWWTWLDLCNYRKRIKEKKICYSELKSGSRSEHLWS